MAKDFILPDIGEGIVECELMEWMVAEGDRVEEDQAIADVMTDKALVSIPSPHAGVITKLYYDKGDIAAVHKPLFQIEVDGEQTGDDGHSVAESSDKSSDKSSDQAASVTAPSAASGATQIHDFLLPDIGEGIVECELMEWLAEEGEAVKEDQPVAEVMTDKALVQIPAIADGVIVKHYCAKGQVAQVHKPLFAIEIATEASTEQAPVSDTGSTATSSDQTQTIAPKTVQPKTVRPGKALASPAVRRLARIKGVDIAQVPGSGDKGRVYKQDIEAFVKGDQPVQATAQAAEPLASTTVSSQQDKVEPIRGVKAAMAKAMTQSVSTIPHFTYCEEFDITELVALRNDMKARYQTDTLKLSMMPFFIKALSESIKQFPVMNARVNDDCTELTYVADHNIGLAVDSPIGLLVPNIKQCQNKSILEIAQELTDIINQARAGRLAPTQMSGGSISISNIGAIGGTVATPIINKPEVAIVALGRTQTLPRFDDAGQVQARQIMQVSWSGDHRVIDGGTIARFNNLWKSFLEKPQTLLVNLR
ncbi:dihydrolipoyllysine-residue acetyltransferase [Paraferrimonas haliotis]|uniref:Dihydrolipoamide acetyltransferase component of pyruvate dehydrogenase complex n=1 Tax=Paraferrimonas haliotis TaxID=2013866 RepID=A0AA37TMQ3_9GAMM|nr:dihydrolipoyllysine-residue acetyltransferase [Paraferrimonas haliotis]GLS84464.1 dihydrolipoamide acetyltransferase component of pyruvate dehydrogenase complex [Paraferrimonas haliotis]